MKTPGIFLFFFALGLIRAASAQDIVGIDPVKAYEMVRIPGVYLVDVRSIAEYVWVGHPDMAHNIPFAFWNEMTQSMDPNTGFLEDLKARFKPGDTLVFICRSGGRSLKAAQAARSAGFPRVFNVIEGFEGELDAKGHRTVGGWKYNGLPFTYKVDPELKYNPGSPDAEKNGPYLGQKPPGMVPEVFAPGLISTENLDWAPSFSPDGLECYFTHWPQGKPPRIMRRANELEAWSSFEPVSFSSPFKDADPFVAPDGNRLYFWSSRPAGEGAEEINEADLWAADRSAEGWRQARRLESSINTGSWQVFPTVAMNGNLYFTSYDEHSLGGLDIYRSAFIGGRFEPPVNLGPIVNSPHIDEEACIAPDESYLVFCSDRHAPKSGDWDLYVSFRKADGGWTEALSMGKAVNSSHMEQTPLVTADGRFLFFCSHRTGKGDVYWVDAKIIETLKQGILR